MSTPDQLDSLFISFAFFFQLALIVHFAVRRAAFERAIRYGRFVYALGIPALMLSVVQIGAGKPWYLWLAGVLCATWAAFGYVVEYKRQIEWRSPILWPVFGPYITLYLATNMFYWWPLARFSQPLWLAYGFLFVVATVLNIASHRGTGISPAHG